jgi:hypothetical protein
LIGTGSRKEAGHPREPHTARVPRSSHRARGTHSRQDAAGVGWGRVEEEASCPLASGEDGAPAPPAAGARAAGAPLIPPEPKPAIPAGIRALDHLLRRDLHVVEGSRLQRTSVSLPSVAVEYELGEGPCLDAVLDQPVVQVDDIRTDRRWPAYGRHERQNSWESARSWRSNSGPSHTPAAA